MIFNMVGGGGGGLRIRQRNRSSFQNGRLDSKWLACTAENVHYFSIRQLRAKQLYRIRTCYELGRQCL